MNNNSSQKCLKNKSLNDLCLKLNMEIAQYHPILIDAYDSSKEKKVKLQFGANNIFVCSKDRQIIYCLNNINTNEYTILYFQDNKLTFESNAERAKTLSQQHPVDAKNLKQAQLYVKKQLETTYKNIYLKQLEQKKKKTIEGKERRDLIKNENQIMKKTYANMYKKQLKKNNNSRMISESSDENKTAEFHYCNHCYTCKATKKLNAKKNNSKQMMINKDKTLTLEQQKKPNDKQTTKKEENGKHKKINIYKLFAPDNKKNKNKNADNSTKMINKDKTLTLEQQKKPNDKQTTKKTYADMYKKQLKEKGKNCNKQIINQKTVKLYATHSL